ncbi:hypothetical protein N7G274_009996 [Stereocaulon virgatum]|uniref:Ribosomal protein S13 n=1 Tax=Stereocaulon virgatum TaxID=373712 RepID=A0ABR3ZYZ5_9LECA
MPNPDEQLVYLHCSSIFTGADAEVRKLKNVTKVLLRHNLSIEGLTDKFPLNRIATVAKKKLLGRAYSNLGLRHLDAFQNCFGNLKRKKLKAKRRRQTLPESRLKKRMRLYRLRQRRLTVIMTKLLHTYAGRRQMTLGAVPAA